MLPRVLVIEDSGPCLKLAEETLKRISHVDTASTFCDAQKLIDENTYSLFIVDLHLPDKDGLEITNYIRNNEKNSQAMIVIATGDTEVSKKVTAFSVGADDYVVKPYSPLELRARVERHFSKSKNDQFYKDGESGLHLNNFNYKAFISIDKGQLTDLLLTPNEFKLLNFFIRHKDRIFSRNQLIDTIWGKDTFINDRTIDVHIAGLRKKLKSFKLAIASIRGEGYRWDSRQLNLAKSS